MPPPDAVAAGLAGPGLRILHCPEVIGGHPPALAAAERELGLRSRSVALHPHPFGYAADQVLSNGGRFGMSVARLRLLWFALRDADVVHFNFGQSAMPQRIALDVPWATRYPHWMRRLYNLCAGAVELRDVAWLRHAGKKIVVTYQGDDARQADVLRRLYDIHPADEAGYYSDESDGLKRERIDLFARHAHAILALNPDLLNVLPAHASFLPYAVPAAASSVAGATGAAVPLLLHAPSHQGAKGTRFVLEAVNRLRAEGVRFDFSLVEGLPHAEAMLRYAHADLLVDQLLVGWYGGLAVEAMALGKPVICFVRDSDLRYVPEAMRTEMPLIQANPATIYEVLKHWLTVPRPALAARGAQGRAYAERWHHPRSVALSTLETYSRIACTASTVRPGARQ